MLRCEQGEYSLSNTLFMDIETTGRHPPRDRLVEVAVIDVDENPLLHTLVNPGCSIGDQKAHVGITADALRTAPSLEEVWPVMYRLVRKHNIVAFNAEHDRRFFPAGLAAAAAVNCAMVRFAGIYGEWEPFRSAYRWKKLQVAMDYYGLQYRGQPHRALTDALACRDLWVAMETDESFGARPSTVADLRVVEKLPF